MSMEASATEYDSLSAEQSIWELGSEEQLKELVRRFSGVLEVGWPRLAAIAPGRELGRLGVMCGRVAVCVPAERVRHGSDALPDSRAAAAPEGTPRTMTVVSEVSHGESVTTTLELVAAPEEDSDGPLRAGLELVGAILASEALVVMAGIVERWDRQVFIHDAAHGLSSVESSVYGLARRLSKIHSQEELEEAREILAEYCDTLVREYAVHRWTLSRLARWYSAESIADIEERAIARIDLVALIDEMLGLYRRLAAAKEIDIRWDVTRPAYQDMPQVVTEVYAARRALHNIIANAFKYSYTGVTTKSVHTERYVRVEAVPVFSRDDDGRPNACGVLVENYGLPIYPDEVPRVVKARYRGRAAMEENVVGSGLGLFEAERIMRQLGGRVRLRSVVQPGGAGLTKVWVIFPLSSGGAR